MLTRHPGQALFDQLDGMAQNNVERTPQEIADARTAWEERRRFGDVAGYLGPRLAAPSLLKFANPSPAS